MIKERVGKHSASTNAVFWRTLFLSVLKWATIAAVAIGALSLGWWLSNRNSASRPPDDNPAMIGSDDGPGSPSPEPSPDGPGAGQILNGSGNPELLKTAEQRVRDAGYEILSTGNASRPYGKTTVFYQEGHRSQADDLAQLAGASVVEPAPANLDKNIPLTLVVGSDFSP